MGSDTQSTATASPTEVEVMAECWRLEPSLREDGPNAFHALSAIGLLRNTSAAEAKPEGAARATEALQTGLGLCIGLLKAERAFLFEAGADSETREARAGSCIVSRDLDGETVNQAERKVSPAVLAEVEKTRRPFLGNLKDDESENWTKQPPDEDGSFRFAAFPVEWQGSLQAVLYVENRFQPLHVDREVLRLANAYCVVVGSVLGFGKLCKENTALWTDLTRLREQEPTPAPGPLPASRERPRHSRKNDLKGDYSAIIGSSARVIEILHVIDRISNSNAPILIAGESGTGKELVAHAVHENSPRKGKVFVSENCGALTETLLESELFGYVKGAFTGANKDHKGLFELAEGGTLFLDEVGDMSPGMQKKLLRVLQEGVIRRVGGKDYVPVDVRVLSATNKDLLEQVHAGNFREDLYYRLNVISLRMPPLRERKEDIPELVEHFMAEMAKEAGITKKIEPAALQCLMDYSWPGNIRELRNEIRRLFALAEGDVGVQDLSEAIVAGEREGSPFQSLERELSSLTLKDAMERLEKEMIRRALVQSRGNKSLVAKILQMPKTSLYNKINKYGFNKL